MAKSSGGIRSLGKRTVAKENRRSEFQKELASGKYSDRKKDSYFDENSGGYYLIEKSTRKHPKVEMEVAEFLAKKGYKVTLIDESGTSIKVDGKIFQVTYEQRTPKGDTYKNFNNALEHAKKKGAESAIIYMKNSNHTRKSVEEGIKYYEKLNQYRFKNILIVTKNGKIHIHKHND